MRKIANYLLVSLLFACGIMYIPLAPATAGQNPPQSARPYSSLEAIEYDAARSGPLLLVDGGNAGSRVRASERPPTLTEFADRVGRTVVTVSGLTVLAPTTMQVIEDRPGTPDPYARLKPEERLRLLLSLFSEDQWKRAGSASGIGPEDLNDNQRPLFMSLLPVAISVQRNLLVAGNEPISIIYEPQGDPQEEDPAATHLRLNRKVSFSFSKVGTDDYDYDGGIDPGPGDEVTTLIQGGEVRGDAPDDPDTVKAFGVPIIQTVPSRLKRSQLDFAAPRLRMQIPLDGDLKTLGDLLSRVAQITGLDLVADRRVATLPLLWRIATGQKARAGDILEALCWSVTGAFRRVGDSTFLLTDDIQGIGTRFAKLAEWAEPPYMARLKALDALNQKTAKNNPLAHIGFAPGDNNTLPPPLLQRVDNSYINGDDQPEVAPTSLPASLQKRVLVAQLPAEDKPLVDLLTLAKRKGFTEVWLHAMLNDGEAAARLRSAVKSARTVGISVGCAVSLLHNGGLSASDDINVFGETGESFFKRRRADNPEEAGDYAMYAGWSVLDPTQVARILTPIASVQGLCALALKATAAPGWAGDIPGGDGIVTNGYLGYTTESRLQCIRAEGFDPIDASPYLYMMEVDPSLPFFPADSLDGVWKALADFRLRENTQMLSQIHAAVRRIGPTLPLYLDDRASQYTDSELAWYARWDSADRIPVNSIYLAESEERATAFASTQEPIRIRYGSNGKPESLAVSFGNTAQDAAKNWRGAALDLARLTPADALHMLSGLPASP